MYVFIDETMPVSIHWYYTAQGRIFIFKIRKVEGNIMSSNTFFNTIVLTTAVFAALISSIANIIISLLNMMLV